MAEDSSVQYWGDKTTAETAELLGRTIMDAIRFQHQLNAAQAENEQLRHDLTRERMARQELESSMAEMHITIDRLMRPPTSRKPRPRRK